MYVGKKGGGGGLTPHSAVRLRKRLATPALAAAEGVTKPEPVSAYVVVMDKNTPPLPALISRLPTSSVTCAVPLSTMSMIVLG